MKAQADGEPPLGVVRRNRAAWPLDLGSFSESGFPQLVAITWFSLSGPAGMPAPVVEKINAETRRALASAKWRERLAGEGIEPNDLDAAAFTRFVQAEVERWTPLAKAVQTGT